MTIQAFHKWASNAELIAAAATLGHLDAEWRTLDPTYGLGIFWKKFRPTRLLAHDLDPTKAPDGPMDFTALAYRDRCFQAVVFDPPYKLRATEGTEALLDANVNEWLIRSDKQWFVRGFKTADETCGIARAFLSDRFNCYDNFDVLMAALQGIRDAGVEVNVVGCDLSERKMSIRIEAPAIAALAPTLLGNYRSPFTGNRGADNPTVFAGFVLSNSETGGGAFSITPRLVAEVCKNGMTITKDALRKVHLGSKMDEGVIRWSDETNRKNVELVAAQATDAVRTFCDVAYVEAKIAEMEEKCGRPVEPTKVIEKVGKALSFTKDEQDGILSHFIQGADITAGGVMHSITSYAQVVLDPDRANYIEEAGMQALDLAANAR